MVRAILWAHQWVVVIAGVLTCSCCVTGILETNFSDVGPRETTTGIAAAAGVGGRVLKTPSPSPSSKGVEEAQAAARRCIAVEESGQLPEDLALGLFESETASRVGTPQTTVASVEFMAGRHQKQVGISGGDTTLANGTIRINVMLQVGDGSTAKPQNFAAAQDPGSKSARTAEAVDMTASAAAAVAEMTADDPKQAPVAISAVAAWNLAMANGAVQAGADLTTMEIRLEISAAFGYHGRRYTTSIDATLTDDGQPRSGGHNVLSLSTTFDWQPMGDIWDELDEPAVADIKVYRIAPPAFPRLRAVEPAPSVPEKRQGEEQVLLEATLCKRATSVVGGRADVGGTMSVKGAVPAAPAAIKATLTPYTKRKELRQPQQVERREGIVPPNAVARSSPGIFVSEIDDGEWWRAQEEKTYGRGMDAVNALPRLRGWKPGDWRKRRKRRRKQEEERKRRRTEEVARRQAARGGGGDFCSDGDGDSCTGEGPWVWEAVKGALRAVGQMWQTSLRNIWRK